MSGATTAAPACVTAVVRISPRARRMRLTATPEKGLELVAPSATTRAEMQAFLNLHAAWAARTLRRLGTPLDARHARAAAAALPERVELAAVGEMWQVVYAPALRATTAVRLACRREGELRLLNITHPAEGPPPALAVFRLLRQWLRQQAEHILPARVAVVVRETGLPAPARLRVGLQQSVWGSQSARGLMSLSARLLLLPPELVHHVILHELCHQGHMHHRASFHRLLERHDPAADVNRRALREAGRLLPAWCSR